MQLTLTRLIVVSAAVLLATAAAGQETERGDFRDLKLGLTADAMPSPGYVAFACGSNGGPPLTRLDDWQDFARCAPGPSGLHEVYVEYDDELKLYLEAFPDVPPEENPMLKFSGTKIAGHPMILSVLFDEAGVAQGLRAVTDSRVAVSYRRRAYLLGNRVMGRYGREDWECVDEPPAPRENAIGGMFIKKVCEKIYRNDRRVVISTNLFRKPGQTGFDEQGNYRPGDFENSTRIEIWSLTLPAF